MSLPAAMSERLQFLSRVVVKECNHLADTDRRLFTQTLTPEHTLTLCSDPVGAERLEAFVSRFGRLQDTVGDKLLPALLVALAEPIGAAIDNLDRAEKLGLIVSADQWMDMRRLRNQMVHEYIEDLQILSSALRTGHDFVPVLVTASQACVAQVSRLLKPSAT
jgi:uncharacterized protein with HEPN domain